MKEINVLVVDDVPSLVKLLEDIIKHLGHQPVSAKDGEEAWLMIAKDPTRFGLVISDIIMPKMDGMKLFRLVKDLPTKIPVILISGYHTYGEAVYDADAFFSKPFDIPSIQAKIKELLPEE